jgi:integrase
VGINVGISGITPKICLHMKLNDKQIKALKPQAREYKMFDGNGLFLLVHPNGSKYWRLSYRVNKKPKTLSIGVYPEVSLAEARDKTNEARKQLSANIDPSYNKKLEKLKSQISAENTLEAVARSWHANKYSTWTPRHAEQIIRRLEADIFPQIGFRPIDEITAPELLAAIRLIEKRGALDIAKRALQMTGQVIRYAVQCGIATKDITPSLKGALKPYKKQNYAHLSEAEMPEFIAKLENYDGDLQTKLGLKLLILTMVRTGELRGARWEELNFDKAEWNIPEARMKMRRKHIVPLSKQALELFKQIKETNEREGMQSEYVFPNRNNARKHMSENTMLYAIYRMGYHSRTTGHGFRATASTILNEKGFKHDVIERQLAHADNDKVRAAYNHAQYIPERREMMQWWANYVDEMKGRSNGKI